MGSEAWVRALWVQPFLDYSRSLGASTELQLGESGVEELRGAPGIPCPSRFMFTIIDEAIRTGGGRCSCTIGHEVGRRSGIRALDSFGRRVASQVTLGAAIRTAAMLMPSVHSARTLELADRGRYARLSSKLDDSCLSATPWEDGFVASILTDLVRLAAGGDWRPRSLSLQSAPAEPCRGTLSDVPVRHGEEATAIEFPRELLDRGLALRKPPPAPTEEEVPLPVDDVSGARFVLGYLVRQGDASIDSLAAAVGMSCRTLQRQLGRGGQTFTGMLEQVRTDMARQLLESSSAKVIDVAYDVGYSDPSHFTRAFRRWTGVAPSAYRRARVSAAP